MRRALLPLVFAGCALSTERPLDPGLDLEFVGDWTETAEGWGPASAGSLARVEGPCDLHVEIATSTARPDVLDRWGVTLFGGALQPTYVDDGGVAGVVSLDASAPPGDCHALILAPTNPTAGDVLIGAWALEP